MGFRGLKQLMLHFPRWRRGVRGQIKAASREILSLPVSRLIEELRARYNDLQAVLVFLGEIQRDIIEVGEQLKEQPKIDGDLSNIVITYLS